MALVNVSVHCLYILKKDATFMSTSTDTPDATFVTGILGACTYIVVMFANSAKLLSKT